MIQKLELLYEGKAKILYATNDSNYVIIYYKDDTTSGNGQKKAEIHNKGQINNQIATIIYEYLEKNSIPTHFIEKRNEREQLCHKVQIIPLEVIVRNRIAGSMAKRLAVTEGTKIENTIFEVCYKNDSLGDPLINDHHAVAIGLTNYEELSKIYDLAAKINVFLQSLFSKVGVELVDFKLEFGRTNNGRVVLADEISPDTCRLWDSRTGEKLDKDRFRRDLGNVEGAYLEILKRLQV